MRVQVLSLLEKHTMLLGRRSHFARAFVAIWMFDWLDKLRLQGFPAEWYEQLEQGLDGMHALLNTIEGSFEWSLNGFQEWSTIPEGDIQLRTGKVYADLWKNFNAQEYFGRAKALLEERFAKNDVSVQGVQHALDDGCGSGRYTIALQYMGCQRVTGIDISADAIELAEKRNPIADAVSFQRGSVLELPFADSTFDFVFSNGVLHHTLSTEQGLSEIYRVLQPGGACWLYLYGGKNSLFWDIVDSCRVLVMDIPQHYTEALMKVLGYPAGRVFHRLDFFYVPIHRRYYAGEVEAMILEAGFTSFRRLHRGVVHDWDEIKRDNPHMHPYIYGEGEMRYWLEKE